MIPKIMHQIWLGKNSIPEKSLEWIENWKSLHPSWEYKLWMDDDVAKIKNDRLHKLISIPDAYSSKSNILRIYVVLIYGGLYFDVDFDWNKNIDEFTNYKAVCCKEVPDRYNCAFLGAEKNNEWIQFMWDSLDEYVGKEPPWGPTHATHAVEKKGDTLTTLPTEYLYPYLWDEAYKDRRMFPDSYAVHHWNKSWAKK